MRNSNNILYILTCFICASSLNLACSSSGGGDESGSGGQAAQTLDFVQLDGPFPRLNISGESANNGIFDPSLEYGPDGVGWLAYSAVSGSRAPFGPYVETNLARSADSGASWQYVQTINNAIDESFTAEGGVVVGNRNYEVSSLLYDAHDPGKEWKLFNHRTFVDPASPELTLAQYSWISYRYTSAAQTPAGIWSSEAALLGGGPTPLAPFNSLPQTAISSLHPELERYLVYSEPGTVMKESTIFMSLTALTTKPEAIVLIASDDHALTWRYVATLLGESDAAAFGFDSFDGSSLVVVGDQYYLFASPKKEDQYTGTYVFLFSDLDSGQMHRGSNGQLEPLLYITPNPDLWAAGGRNAGQSDYDQQNSAGGIIFPQISLGDAPELFQLFSTNYHIP